MARSYKHTPVGSNAKAESDKPWKVMSHRAERRAVRAALAGDSEPQSPRAFGNPWKAPKDGKHWMHEGDPRDLRK